MPSSASSENIICTLGSNECKFMTEVAALRQEVNSLTEMVRTDALTGLYNFRFFNETLLLEMERTRRGTQPLSMIILDVDHFKKFNDNYGHEIGNHALMHIAKLIKLAVRKLDFPCRFGGEEFVILLPNTDIRQSVQVADRLREMIASTPFSSPGFENLTVTASLGVDQFTATNGDTVEDFIRRVDSLLYASKHNGRNQVSYPLPSVQSNVVAVTVEEKDALFNILNNEN